MYSKGAGMLSGEKNKPQKWKCRKDDATAKKRKTLKTAYFYKIKIYYKYTIKIKLLYF